MLGIFEKLLITSSIKITSELSKYSLDQVKKDITFYQVVGLLGIDISPKDDYDQLYTQSTLIILRKYNEYPELKELLINKEVKSAFENEKYNNAFNAFSITLDGQLHTNINVKQLKDWNEVPKHIIDDFFEVYEVLLNKAKSPIQKENSLYHEKTHSGIEEIKSMLTSFNGTVQSVPLTDIENKSLQEEYQRQIKLIASSIEKGFINKALNRLLEIKNDLWDKIDNSLKFKVLTNIGICYDRLDKVEDSCQYLINAFDLNKEDKVALTNAINAYCILNDVERASVLMHQLIEKYPDYVMTYANMIRVFSHSKPIDQILKEIPEKFLNEFEVLFSLGITNRLNKRFEEAVIYLKKAIDIKVDNKFAKEYLLNTLLEKYNLNFSTINLRLINKEVKNEIEDALKLSDEVLEFYKHSDILTLKVRLHVNKGFLFHLLSDFDKAIIEMDLALRLEPNNAITLMNKAFVLAVMNKTDLAIQILKGIVDEDSSSDKVCLLAEMYMKDNKVDDAIQLLEKHNNSNDTIKSFLIELYLTKEDVDSAERILLINYTENNISDLISKSKIEFQKQNKEISKEILFKVITLLNNNTSVKLKYLLAEELSFQGYSKKAIDIYTSFADTEIDNRISYKLARLYYLIGEKGESLKILRSIRENSGISYASTPLEISIYQEYRDYEKACIVAEEYFHRFPNDLLMRIRLTGIYMRLEKYNEADKLLSERIDFQSLPYNMLETYISQLIIRGQNKSALNVVYEYRRKANNADAHNIYVVTFLKAANDKVPNRNFDSVEIDTVVHLQNDEKIDFHFIIENRPSQEQNENEINTSDNKFDLFKKSKINKWFKFTNQSEIFSHKVKIVNIEHKYIFAWRESLKLLETVFADKKQFYSSKAEDIKPLLQQLLEEQKPWIENYKKAIEFYKQKVIPIGTIAQKFSQNQIETWNIFTKNDKIGIECAFGFSEEWESALNCFNKNGLCIVADIFSLLTLFELQFFEIISANYGKLLITNSTIDIILDKINEENLFPKLNNSEKSKHEQLYESIKNHCVFFTPQSTISLSNDYKYSQEKLIGAASFDTIYLAKEKSAIILSDDLAFRRLCKDEHSLDGIWSQVILKDLHKKGIIDHNQYQFAVFKLTQLNYFHTSIDYHTLLKSLELSNYRLNNQLSKTIDYLRNNISSEESSIIVASRFIIELWLDNNVSNESKKNILFYTLDTLCFDRIITKVTTNIGNVIKIIFREYLDNPNASILNFMQIEDNIELWEEQYFKKLILYFSKHPLSTLPKNLLFY